MFTLSKEYCPLRHQLLLGILHRALSVVIACVAPLTYLVQLQDGRIWRRHIDHILLKDDEVQEIPTRPEQSNCDHHGEDWSYGEGFESNSILPNSQAAAQEDHGGT